MKYLLHLVLLSFTFASFGNGIPKKLYGMFLQGEILLLQPRYKKVSEVPFEQFTKAKKNWSLFQFQTSKSMGLKVSLAFGHKTKEYGYGMWSVSKDKQTFRGALGIYEKDDVYILTFYRPFLNPDPKLLKEPLEEHRWFSVTCNKKELEEEKFVAVLNKRWEMSNRVYVDRVMYPILLLGAKEKTKKKVVKVVALHMFYYTDEEQKSLGQWGDYKIGFINAKSK